MNYVNPKNARNSDDEDDVVTRIQKKPYQHYEHAYTTQHVHFYLSEDVGAPEEYTDMVHRINVAGENDTIFIHLNTPGGRLDTGVQIINAMQNTAATVVTILEAEAFSLGTLIFLAGDELIVNDHCMIMFHNFKGGVSGKGHEQLAQLGATVKWFTAIAREIYIPFLTEEEFNGIIEGKDLWMHSAEIRERIQKMIDLQDAAAVAEADKKAAVATGAIKERRSTKKDSKK